MKRISALAFMMFFISVIFAVLKIVSFCMIFDGVIDWSNIPIFIWFALFAETAVIGAVAIVFVGLHIRDKSKKEKSHYAHKY